MITSLQNERVKLVHNLQKQARARRKENKIVLEGEKLIGDALARGHRPLYVLYDPNTARGDMLTKLMEADVDLIDVSGSVIRHVSDTQHPQGIVALFAMPRPRLPRNPKRVLVLDSLRDPGNMGTILRTAAAAGVQLVILSPESADPYNPKALRAGTGAHFRLPVVEAPWQEIGAYCDGLNVYAATANGTLRYDQADWRAPHVLIIGNEGTGLSQQALAITTAEVYVPMAASTESLNAAMAAGVLLFEAARQNLTA